MSRAVVVNSAWPQVWDTPHLSYRQFEYWCRRGLIRSGFAKGQGGPGDRRTLPAGEVTVVATMAALVHAGLNPAAAATLARQLATGGVGTLGAFLVVLGPQDGVSR